MVYNNWIDIKAYHNKDLNITQIRGESDFGTFHIHLIPSAFNRRGTSYHVLDTIFSMQGELTLAVDKAVHPDEDEEDERIL